MAISKLLQYQFEFTSDLVLLIDKAIKKGYNPVITECGLLSERKYDNSKARGIQVGRDRVHKVNGNHYRRLAADILLYDENGNWQKFGTETIHEVLGIYWESLREGNINGRGFNDANHYARIWEGVK